MARWHRVDFKILSEDTQGRFAVVEHPIEPGRLVPPHVHDDVDEFSFVVEGQIGVRIGDQEATAGPGTYVLKPRGIPHTFWNAGPGPARILEILSPGGFEHFFEDQARVYAEKDPAERARLMSQLSGKMRGRFVPEWVPQLTAKYGLKLVGQD